MPPPIVAKQSTAVRRSTRAGQAALMAVLILLQGLAAITDAVAGKRASVGARATIALIRSDACASRDDRDRSPTHQHSDVACCILCNARGSIDSKLFIVPTDGAPIADPRAPTRSTRGPRDASAAVVFGRTIGWSSRAPPSSP